VGKYKTAFDTGNGSSFGTLIGGRVHINPLTGKVSLTLTGEPISDSEIGWARARKIVESKKIANLSNLIRIYEWQSSSSDDFSQEDYLEFHKIVLYLRIHSIVLKHCK